MSDEDLVDALKSYMRDNGRGALITAVFQFCGYPVPDLSGVDLPPIIGTINLTEDPDALKG